MKTTNQSHHLDALTKEDFDFLRAYEWKRNRQKELMGIYLNMIRSNPSVCKNLFQNAFKGALAFAFKDEELAKEQQQQENGKTQLLEWSEVVGEK